MSLYQLPDWPRCKKPPLDAGLIRQSARDFRVEEEIPFELTGQGEHIWLKIRKRQLTTNFVASRLSKWAGVKRMAVGFAGQKDKHADTTQWFSIHLPGKDLPDTRFDLDNCDVLQISRHTQKLRRGALKKNRFNILVREVSGDKQQLERRAAEIMHAGVPNYFTEQRFGRCGDNVERAAAFFTGDYRVKGREQRSMLLSAARSWLFNQVLAYRVVHENWDKALPGELLMLSGSRSVFPFSVEDTDISSRLLTGDIHPTGPLPGSGKFLVSAEVGSLERDLLQKYPVLTNGLIEAGVKASRRSLRLIPEALHLEWIDAQTLSLSFALPPGSYATAVLRELVCYTDASRESRV